MSVFSKAALFLSGLALLLGAMAFLEIPNGWVIVGSLYGTVQGRALLPFVAIIIALWGVRIAASSNAQE